MVNGYKKTEIGLIPENWDIRLLGEISTPKARIGWQNLRKDEYLDSGIYMLITGTDFSEGRIDYSTCKYVTEERYDQDTNIQVGNGDILITKDGTLGKVAMITNLNVPATLNSGVFVLNNLSPVINNRFLYHYLSTNRLMKYAERTSTGGTIQHLNQSVLVSFPVPIPPIDEQQKMADALTDIDDLIVEEGKLVSKYQAMKQGCLQHMFPRKGQTEPDMRLPGFTGAWEQRKVSDVAERYDNLRIPVAANLRKSGETPYYGANGIQDYVDGFTHDGEFILVAEDGANDLKNYPVNYVNGRIWVNNHAHVLQGKALEVDTRFLGYAISQADIESVLVGGGRAKLNADVLMNIDLLMPEKSKQQKIGAFFASLGKTITLHQRKCEKYKMIKQGMMEDLLTGKVRLK